MTLMQEAISFMCGAELPCLMLDSMRVGPGDGDILGAQSDYYMSTRGGGMATTMCRCSRLPTVRKSWISSLRGSGSPTPTALRFFSCSTA